MNPSPRRTPTRALARATGAMAAAGMVGLLSAATPAWAVDPFFTVTFGPDQSTEATGVRAAATFSFVDAGSFVDMTVTLSNLTGTTPPPLISQPTASEFVALAFQLPSNISTVDLGAGANADLGYTPSNGSLFDIAVANAALPPFDSTAPRPPLTPYSLCITAGNGDGCTGGGNPGNGLNNATLASAAGTFRLSAADVSGALAFRQAFFNFYQPLIPPTGDPAYIGPIAARFKAIQPGGRSDKLLAGTIGGGGQAPGDEVPGPVPLLGAAAAFGTSRKLRRRIGAHTPTP
ncbi:hypothetical protein [Synechococcus sp. CCAP 1479/9]|uniref:hypothetical protein n=1 Tax=Synechococcus sp. CCAP 1479/9 TaxID=1221593 RepID=UPI001C213181|nr:hypothetical protein [Synechococcus sp. CCAP 1479/9]